MVNPEHLAELREESWRGIGGPLYKTLAARQDSRAFRFHFSLTLL